VTVRARGVTTCVARWCLLALGAGATASWAGEFRQMFEAALVNDSAFRAAQQEMASSKQALPLARAALRPTIAFSASDGNVRGSRTAPNFLGNQVTSPLDYNTPQYNLTLRLPLINFESLRRYQQAERQLEYADSVFLTRLSDLLERLGSAYFQRLYATDLVRSAATQVDLAAAQADAAASRLQRGEGTRPEVVEAQAALDLARVQWRDAQDQLANAQLALEHVSGLRGEPVAGLAGASSAPWPALFPATLEGWIQKALADNAAIRARRQAIEMARLAVARARAGHYPRLDLVAGISQSSNDSINTLNQSSRQNSLGLQLNVPIYSGGGVDAAVVQALAEQAKAEAELETEERTVARDVQRFFLTAAQGEARTAAFDAAVQAARLTLDGARRVAAAGLGTAADVLAAQRRVVDAERELAKVRYEDLLARLRLQLRAGLEAADVVEAVDALMMPAAGAARPPTR
jgi:protease secretion system outer membrane protein